MLSRTLFNIFDIMGEKVTKPSPFLRWAGSKRKLIPELKKFWKSEYKVYHEPFMGSAQLFFSISDASEYVLSDRNENLVEAYQQLKNHPYEVYRYLKNFKNNRKEYYSIRDLDQKRLGCNQRTARFIYLNWLCFNGLYRTNKDNRFNVPYSGETKKNIYRWDILKAASKKLQNAKILYGDFEVVVRENVKAGEFVYLDPPYAVENQKIFTQYCNHTFGINDIERLKDVITYIDKIGAYFLLSYANTNKIKSTFQSWPILEVSVQRNIAGFAEHRRMSKELIISNIL